jgi:hypothetical protein
MQQEMLCKSHKAFMGKMYAVTLWEYWAAMRSQEGLQGAENGDQYRRNCFITELTKLYVL